MRGSRALAGAQVHPRGVPDVPCRVCWLTLLADEREEIEFQVALDRLPRPQLPVHRVARDERERAGVWVRRVALHLDLEAAVVVERALPGGHHAHHTTANRHAHADGRRGQRGEEATARSDGRGGGTSSPHVWGVS